MAKKKRKKRIKLKKRRAKPRKGKKKKIPKRKKRKTIKTTTKDSFKQTKDSDGNLVFKVSKNWSKEAYINKSQYEKKYKLSIKEKEIGFWLKEESKVKHEKCAEVNKELKCAICNGSAGCMDCEFAEICDRENVSKLCICKKCEG